LVEELVEEGKIEAKLSRNKVDVYFRVGSDKHG